MSSSNKVSRVKKLNPTAFLESSPSLMPRSEFHLLRAWPKDLSLMRRACRSSLTEFPEAFNSRELFYSMMVT